MVSFDAGLLSGGDDGDSARGNDQGRGGHKSGSVFEEDDDDVFTDLKVQ